MHGCLKALLDGIAALIILMIVGYFFWAQDNKLRDYGIATIEAMPLSANDKLMHLAIANHYHLNAANSGPKVTRRSTDTPDEAGYWKR